VERGWMESGITRTAKRYLQIVLVITDMCFWNYIAQFQVTTNALSESE
jgi:hypothetical protein